MQDPVIWLAFDTDRVSWMPAGAATGPWACGGVALDLGTRAQRSYIMVRACDDTIVLRLSDESSCDDFGKLFYHYLPDMNHDFDSLLALSELSDERLPSQLRTQNPHTLSRSLPHGQTP